MKLVTYMRYVVFRVVTVKMPHGLVEGYQHVLRNVVFFSIRVEDEAYAPSKCL